MPFVKVNENVAYVFVAAPVGFFFAWLARKIERCIEFFFGMAGRWQPGEWRDLGRLSLCLPVFELRKHTVVQFAALIITLILRIRHMLQKKINQGVPACLRQSVGPSAIPLSLQPPHFGNAPPSTASGSAITVVAVAASACLTAVRAWLHALTQGVFSI